MAACEYSSEDSRCCPQALNSHEHFVLGFSLACTDGVAPILLWSRESGKKMFGPPAKVLRHFFMTFA